ncbi:MAG: hypothetical protein ACREQL_06835 [Candidatus Binatia bacterium]
MFRRVPVLLVVAVLAGSPSGASARRAITIRIPRVALPAGGDIETCYFVKIPATSAFELGSWRVTHAGTTSRARARHFLVYLYTGERLAEFTANTLALSRGCLDLGPADRDRRVLVATAGSNRKLARAFPKGLAAELAPAADAPGGAPSAIGLLIDTNWGNADTKTRTVSSRVVLRAAPAKGLKRTARPLSDRTAEMGILVPPFSEGATEDLVDARWTAPTDSCVLGLSTQMHRRGRCAGVDLVGTDGQPQNPAGSPENLCDPGRRQLFVGLDYTDPGALGFTTALPVRAGESLRYGCWLDNGARSTPVRLGCEETMGVPPGGVGDPAAMCALCAGQAACVPANATAGESVDDEVCGITGFVYDAAPGGGCDISGLP